MTLDAGGTNLVFNAVQHQEEILEPVILPAKQESLEEILLTIIDGFKKVEKQLPDKAVAISFAFPGPAEYEQGIIGDLENLPLFRGGVALGPMLEEHFQLPVFINNDCDLFAYGEAIAGLLPEINQKLKERNSSKTYQNLFGITFGTGFGGGIVSKGQLFTGDNSAQGEVNRMSNKLYSQYSVEESTSIKGVRRVYLREAGLNAKNNITPKDIFEIGSGKKPGNQKAALRAFEELAIAAGDAVANAITLIDGLVVLGGGLSGAHPLFLQKMVDEMNKHFTTPIGKSVERMEIRAFNLENPTELETFLNGDQREITVPFSDKKLKYDPLKRMGVGISRLGTSKAVSIGAYAFALDQL
jgi:glucokinase